MDDLDKGRPTEYGAEQIFTAIDQRLTAGKALLVTSNLRLNELAGKWPEPFGGAIVDRLAGYCEAYLLEEAGVPWAGFHTFRHTTASLLFARGLNVKAVQKWHH
jgi:integrase